MLQKVSSPKNEGHYLQMDKELSFSTLKTFQIFIFKDIVSYHLPAHSS